MEVDSDSDQPASGAAAQAPAPSQVGAGWEDEEAWAALAEMDERCCRAASGPSLPCPGCGRYLPLDPQRVRRWRVDCRGRPMCPDCEAASPFGQLLRAQHGLAPPDILHAPPPPCQPGAAAQALPTAHAGAAVWHPAAQPETPPYQQPYVHGLPPFAATPGPAQPCTRPAPPQGAHPQQPVSAPQWTPQSHVHLHLPEPQQLEPQQRSSPLWTPPVGAGQRQHTVHQAMHGHSLQQQEQQWRAAQSLQPYWQQHSCSPATATSRQAQQLPDQPAQGPVWPQPAQPPPPQQHQSAWPHAQPGYGTPQGQAVVVPAVVNAWPPQHMAQAWQAAQASGGQLQQQLCWGRRWINVACMICASAPQGSVPLRQ